MFFFFWGVPLVMLFWFSFRLLIPPSPCLEGLQATGKPEPGNYRILSQVNHGSPPACRWRYLWLFFNFTLLFFMPAYQHFSRHFGVSTRAFFRSMEELPRQSTLAYAALHHILLSTLPAAYHNPHLRLHTSPHAPPATVHARRQLRPILSSAAG